MSIAIAEPAPPLLAVEQVAEMLNCSTRTVYRLADRDAMPRPVRVGALVRWSRAAISTWIESGCPASRRASRK